KIGLWGYVPHADVALMRVLLGTGAIEEASSVAEAALQRLEKNGPFGLIESAVRLQVVRARQASGRLDAARETARVALAQVASRAAKIGDEAARRAFCTDVPEHAELNALAASLGADPAR